MTVRRCVGAFRKVCLMATATILCDGCWAIVEAASASGRNRGPARGGADWFTLSPLGWQAAQSDGYIRAHDA